MDKINPTQFKKSVIMDKINPTQFEKSVIKKNKTCYDTSTKVSELFKKNKISELDFAKFIYSSENPEEFKDQLKTFCTKYLAFYGDEKKRKRQAKIIKALSYLGVESKSALMKIIGISSTSQMNFITESLIEEEYILETDTTDPDTKIKANVYNLTQQGTKSKRYYKLGSKKHNDLFLNFYIKPDFINNLKLRKKSFEELKKEAEFKLNKPNTKFQKCVHALMEWNQDNLSFLDIRNHLSIMLEIAPKSKNNFDELFNLFLEKGVLIESSNEFSNKIYKINKGDKNEY
jgi:hypothetical protein